ncbi:NAD-dependent epimerase/dehydratase family protein [Niabella drilacis]|uniref:NAD dependent epimerase/dehydratase family protein n=1 Tax=Niabella drilacis (strain DSM 25811 / CCM 8410 / CCUG 62505 / LMG 26954 / E90) TaxID=1285928 RepID=A0A1G6ZFY0_NIADE|nr:NAD-dependent epimerase/dehydratase family protein [Niabella drilacis]SDE01263.1 NAD dependent epimerase/dehydratase family protein [Niabella drilacis]
MIVGNGMIARRFSVYQERDDFVVFASGVSNSKSQRDADYAREMELLRATLAAHPERQLVYFSTCSIYDPTEQSGHYVQHKLRVEDYIRRSAARFYIFRVSNVVGPSGNPNTIFNYYINHIRASTNFDVWAHASRNLIDLDDVFAVADHILKQGLYRNQTTNIANKESYPVLAVVKTIEQFLQQEGSYTLVERGSSFDIDVSAIAGILEELQIGFGPGYLVRLLQKYSG